MNVPRVTFDTNAIISTWKEEDQTKACQKIESLARNGQISLAVPSNLDFDDNRGWAVQWLTRGKSERWLTEIPAMRRREYINPAAPEPLDVDPELESKIIRCLHPDYPRPWEIFKRNDQMDIDHLLSHVVNERDVFITGDKGILSKASCLKELGIEVMSPAEFLTTIGISLDNIY